jgi:hypothetical protein
LTDSPGRRHLGAYSAFPRSFLGLFQILQIELTTRTTVFRGSQLLKKVLKSFLGGVLNTSDDTEGRMKDCPPFPLREIDRKHRLSGEMAEKIQNRSIGIHRPPNLLLISQRWLEPTHNADKSTREETDSLPGSQCRNSSTLEPFPFLSLPQWPPHHPMMSSGSMGSSTSAWVYPVRISER